MFAYTCALHTHTHTRTHIDNLHVRDVEREPQERKVDHVQRQAHGADDAEHIAREVQEVNGNC